MQCTGHKKNKNNFNKFRRLESNAAYGIRNLGAISIRPQNKHHRQSRNAHQSIHPRQIFQEFHFPDKKGDKHSCGDGNRNNNKLFYRPLIRKSCQYHKSYAQKHTHIVDDQPVCPWIYHMKQYRSGKQDNLLENIKKQITYLPCFKTNGHKTRKMNRKHQKILPCINPSSAFLLLKAEYRKRFISI